MSTRQLEVRQLIIYIATTEVRGMLRYANLSLLWARLSFHLFSSFRFILDLLVLVWNTLWQCEIKIWYNSIAYCASSCLKYWITEHQREWQGTCVLHIAPLTSCIYTPCISCTLNNIVPQTRWCTQNTLQISTWDSHIFPPCCTEINMWH